MTETIVGVVQDTLSRSQVDRHIVPDAVHFHVHDGEQVAMVKPAGRDHPVRPLFEIPIVGTVVGSIAGSLYSLIVPYGGHPKANPVVIAPAGTFETGEHVTIQVEPVVDPDTPAGDGSTLTYRLVEREGSQ